MSKQAKKARKAAQRKKVQKRFKARVAAGKSGLTGGAKGSGAAGRPGSTMSIYRASQRQRISDAAKARNQAFQDSRAGLDSQKLGAEATRLTGIPSGTDLKPGMLTISDAGKAQAEENKAIKAAKDSTIASSFNYDFNNFANNAARGFNLVSVADRLAPKGGLSSYYMSGNRPNMSFMDAYKLEKGMQQQTGKFDPNRKFNLASYARGESNPFRGMPGYGTIKSLVNPRIRNINYNRVMSGKPPLSMDKVNPGGFQTAPTEFTRRVLPGVAAFLPGYNIGSKIFNYGGSEQLETFADDTIGKINPASGTAGTDKFSMEAAAARERGGLLSIGGFKVPELGLSEYIGINTANRAPNNVKMATTDAGGLNIGGTKATTKGDPTGRTIRDRILSGINAVANASSNFDTQLAKNVGPAINEAGTVNKLRTETNNFQNLTPNKFNGLSNAEKVKTVQSVLRFTNDSKTAQALGESLGLGKDFKTKINNLAGDLQERVSGVTADRDSLYNVTSQFAKDIGTDTDLKPLNQFLTARSEDNLGEKGKEVAKIFGIDNPLGLTNEMARDIKAAFQDDSPTTEGLSKKERGVIGQIANRILSGKGTDGLREASYGYGNKPAVNAGVTEGAPMNFTDILNTGLALQQNLKGDTLAAKRFAEAKRLIDGRDITAGSLIRGILPRQSGSSRNRFVPTPSQQSVPEELLEELLINQTPTTTPTQTGTQQTGDLANLQRTAYLNALGAYGIDPNLFAQVRQRQSLLPDANAFGTTFNRRYF